MTGQNVAFLLVLVVAVSFFSYSIQRALRTLRVGLPEQRLDAPGRRTWNLLTIGFAQSKILRERGAGVSHAAVFWGFLVLTAGTAEILLQGVWPGFGYEHLLPRPLWQLFMLSQEVFAVIVLAAVSWLLWRRLVAPPKRLQGEEIHSTEAVIILGVIAALMVTLFTTGAFEYVAREGVRATHFGWFRPIATALGGAFGALSLGTAETLRDVSWWAHALLVLGFLNFLPYGKHFHVVNSLINVWFSNTSGPGTVGAMKPMDLEAEVESFGASDVEQLTWKNLLDGYACTECGRCTAACPANITGKVLSPRKIVTDTRDRLREKAPYVVGELDVEGSAEAMRLAPGAQAVLDNRLLDNWITEAELWACTSCRACVQECPVSIDQLEIINELRRALVLNESRFPEEVLPTFESLERNGSPWAFSPADRAQWAEGLDIPTMAEKLERGERPEILFWVGCMGSFDDRAKKITVAFARILQAANVDFAILGQEETCHGDPARRLGNEYLYQVLAKGTIETLDRYEVKTIVTFCPHCFHQMGNEFPQLGGNYEVIHHSTYIERLLEANLVPLQTEHGKRLTMAYHDSCYLGRYNDVYDAPRETLRRALPVVNLVEPARTKSRGLCCGAGGGRMFIDEKEGKRINIERTEELVATGAETIAVACPFCMTMMVDGVAKLEADVNVLDISEVVAAQLDPAHERAPLVAGD
ncbi:MAG: heterodisulfide reductase-related iron-sulfur binding cluster [Gemmatimonadaceae bacterium]|nr:heterodisulfide reductase-related iron-sulfur binding cluster [Gemmatimonadaceae bacterium]